MQDVYRNINKYNLGKRHKALIVFDGMIVDMINDEKINPVITELFITGSKLNISISFIAQSYYHNPK